MSYVQFIFKILQFVWYGFLNAKKRSIFTPDLKPKRIKMSTVSKFLFFFFMGFATVNTSAQTISGMVLDEAGAPMPGCNVYLEGTFFGTSTNDKGEFSFTTEPADSAEFVVEFIGYQDFRKHISIQKDITLSVTLIEAFDKLNAVTVSAGSYGTGDNDKAAVLNSLDVVTTAGALADVSAALQTLPGTSKNGESGRLFVHGGSADETGTYIDGILVHQPYTSSAPNMAVRGRFNPFMFSGTAFSTGGYSAEYGQAMSSVLVMNTNELQDEEALNFGIMTIGADVAGTKKWKNGAITASANYMNLQPYMNLIPQNYGWKSAPEAYGGAISFRQKTAKNGLLKIYATADESNLVQEQTLIGVPDLTQTVGVKNKNRFVNTNWKAQVSEKWIVKLGGSFTYNTDNYGVGAVQLRDKLVGSHVKGIAIHEVNKKFHLRFGTEFFYKSFEKRFSVTDGADSVLSYTDEKPAAFAEAEIYTSNDFVVKAGLRGEYSSYLEKANVSPRVSMAYKLGANSQVSFAYGWFYQDPVNQQLIGRDYLNYEKAEHYILSYTKTFENRNFRGEVYYKKYTSLVKYPHENATYTNNGNGYAYGVDVFFRDKKTIKNGDYWISYSYLKAERNYLNYPEQAAPPFSNAHTISVVYKHWFSRLRSQLGATLSYSSPRPHNNPNNIQFMDETLKTYKSLDLNWSFLHRENIIFFASVTNVLGFENSFGYNYSPVPDANGIYQRTEILPAAKHFFFVGCFVTLSKSGAKNQLDKIN